MKRIAVGLLSVLLAASVAACSGQQGQRTAPSGTTSRTVTSSVPASATTGSMKPIPSSQTLGQWKVTIVTLARKGSTASTSTAPGKIGKRAASARVMAIVRVKNTGSTTLTMNRADWTVVQDTGGMYQAAKQGNSSVTVNPGKGKTMALVFKIPTTQGATYVLRFQPKQGGPGAIEIAVP